MVVAVESQRDQMLLQHFDGQRDASEMKGGLGQNRFASQKRFSDLVRYAQSPVVMEISSISKGDQKARICNSLHPREKPLRLERSLGPRTAPASRIKERREPPRAFSKWSRIILP